MTKDNIKVEAAASKKSKTELFVRLLHPISYPALAFLCLYGSYLFEGLSIISFLAPFFMVLISKKIYNTWKKKPPIKPKTKKQFLLFARLLEPAALLGALLVVSIFGRFVLKRISVGEYQLMILAPALLAMAIRAFWNVSLHNIAWGALTGITYYSLTSEVLIWLPMLGLTISLYLGYALVKLRRHTIAQVIAGFAAGLVSIVAVVEVYFRFFLPF